MTPRYMSTLLITPLFFSSPIHAYTRSRNEVQKGSTMSISSTGRTAACERAMA